jgi:hypothetical protein
MKILDFLNIVKMDTVEFTSNANNLVQSTSSVCLPIFLKYILLGAFGMLLFVGGAIFLYLKLKRLALKIKAEAISITSKINNNNFK